MKFTQYFDFTQSESTGGQTGSVRVRGATDGSYYQYKPSVLDNKMSRRLKAGFTDRENFGEVIASFIGRALLSDEVVPEVSLVYDKANRRVAVASKYLGEGSTLDDFAFDTIGISRSPERSHVLLTSGCVKTNEVAQLSLDQYPELPKSDICDSLALAAMVGDNDVNPGNLVVLKRDHGYQVARIDLGHAFQDLLNAPSSFGGGLRFPNHPVLDFFNRTTVAGAKLGGDISKLKRDYLGLVPSMEMVASLRKMSKVQTDRLDIGIQNARQEFSLLIGAMNENGDTNGIRHVRNSLAAIYKSLKHNTLSSGLGLDDVMKLTFEAIRESTLKNIEDSEKVANVMELQLEIASSIEKGWTISDRGMALIHEGNFPKDELGDILWVSVDNEPGFKGSVEDYSRYFATKNQENIAPQATQVRTSFRDFKIKFRQSVSQEHFSEETKDFFKQKDLTQLRDDLVGYVEIVKNEKDVAMRFSGFRKEEKIAAVQALIETLHGESGENLRVYLPVLNDGRLGKLIKEAISPYGVDALVTAIEKKVIDPVDLPPRDAFLAKP